MKTDQQIPFFDTNINQRAIRNIKNVLDSTFLSEGKLVAQFEGELSSRLGLVNPVAVNSGTSALHLAVVAAGIKSGDEVIMPAQTFVATAMAVLYERGKPIFADINYSTGNIDPDSVMRKITKKTKAIITVDWGGYPCDLDEIMTIARKHKLVVIEDAAHALGATYKGKPIGSIADITCFSFQAIKHLTTGDGGAICCLDKKRDDLVRRKRWFGIDRAGSKPSNLGERVFDIKELGYKYHLNDYAAALGLANLNNLSRGLARRRSIAGKYRKAFADISGLEIFDYKSDRLSSFWLFGMHVERRDDLIAALKSRGVTTSVVHQRIDKYAICGGLDTSLINQKEFDETKIHIPVYSSLTDREVDHIIKSVQKGW